MDEPLILRADVNDRIGWGHVMRCLALAQAYCETGNRALFAIDKAVPGLEAWLREERMEIATLRALAGSADDAEHLADLAHRNGAKWVVVDGYQFGSSYQKTVKSSDLNLLVVDDFGHADYYFADIILNQNIYAKGDLYRNREPHTKLLLGTRYVLLRREFLSFQGWERRIPDVAENVMVTLGGGDYKQVVLKVISGLKGMLRNRLQVVVVLSEKDSNYDEVSRAAESADFGIELKKNVKKMSDLMAWADVAISGAGSTCWELAFMGLPSLVVALADNQRRVAESLVAQGAVESLGWYEDFADEKISQILSGLLEDRQKREGMSRIGRKLVDGHGAGRVARLLQEKELQLRPVREDDRQRLFEWANDPDVRAASFSPDLITWEQHLKWFKSKMDDQDYLIFIAIDSEGNSVGQIRVEREGEEAQISVSVINKFRGKGYGSRIIELASKEAFEGFGIHQIHAYIKIENKNSKSAFTNAGYTEIGLKTVKGQQALHLTRIR